MSDSQSQTAGCIITRQVLLFIDLVERMLRGNIIGGKDFDTTAERPFSLVVAQSVSLLPQRLCLCCSLVSTVVPTLPGDGDQR